MRKEELYHLRFPIGEFTPPDNITNQHTHEWISAIENFPKILIKLIDGLTVERKNWKYRPGGWSIKHVVHHCADSHINSIVRFKLTLTEDEPEIKPYYEDRWAKLIDSEDDDLAHSVNLLTALHAKWGSLLKSLSSDQLKRKFIHPECGKKFSLEETIGTYAWHCNHHLAHIKYASKSKGKFN